jgi:hypothetical protein
MLIHQKIIFSRIREQKMTRYSSLLVNLIHSQNKKKLLKVLVERFGIGNGEG